MFKCRYPRCGKSFSDKSNCRRHTPFFDNNLSIWCCPRAECKMSSGKKSNILRLIENNGLSKMQQRDKINKDKVCPICKTTFTQKFNLDRHILKLHKGEIGNDSSLGSVTSDEQNMLPSFLSDENNIIAEIFPKNLNSSFLNDDGEIIDVNLSKDHQTLIYAISEMEPTPINPNSQENISTNNHSGGKSLT